MPTVLRAQGFDIKIHFNDHAPAHVHAIKGQGEAVITLDPLMALRVWRMNRRDLSKAKGIVRENHGMLIDNWRAIHGGKGT